MLSDSKCIEILNNHFDNLYKDYGLKDDIEFYIDKENKDHYIWSYYVPEFKTNINLICCKKDGRVLYKEI